MFGYKFYAIYAGFNCHPRFLDEKKIKDIQFIQGIVRSLRIHLFLKQISRIFNQFFN